MINKNFSNNIERLWIKPTESSNSQRVRALTEEVRTTIFGNRTPWWVHTFASEITQEMIENGIKEHVRGFRTGADNINWAKTILKQLNIVNNPGITTLIKTIPEDIFLKVLRETTNGALKWDLACEYMTKRCEFLTKQMQNSN